MVALALLSVVLPAQASNAWDHYLRAAELTMTNEYKQLSKMVVDHTQYAYQVNKEFVRVAGRAFDWIDSGNLLTFAPPDQFEKNGDEFEYFQRLKELARLLYYRVDLRFADGNPLGGVDAIVAGLRFGSNIRSGSNSGFSASSQSLTMILGRFELHQPQITLTGSTKLCKLLQSEVARPSLLARVLAKNDQTTLTALDKDFSAAVLDHVSGPPEETLDLRQGISKLTREEQVALRNEIGRALSETVTWADQALTNNVAAIPPMPYESRTGLCRALLEPLTTLHNLLLSSQLRLYTRLRLAVLACKVIEYRWLNDKLPESLDVINDKAITTDPLTGKPFVYAITGVLTFRVHSLGNSITGPVYLKQPARPQEPGEVGPPPPSKPTPIN